jgi:hypothetical protein
MASISRNALDWTLLAIANLTVLVVITWEHHAGEASPNVALISGFLCLLVLNSMLVRAIYSRRKRLGQNNPRGFFTGAVLLALLSGLLTTAGAFLVSEHNDYIELALSNTPLDEIHPERKSLVVEFIRHRAANSRDYERVAAGFKPLSPALYSADSFANESVIRSTSEQYESANNMDFAYHQKQVQAMNEFRGKMIKVDPDYLRSFEAGLDEQDAEEEKLIQLQRGCFTATLALYAYAAKHTKDISVKDSSLHFANNSVQMEFSRQLEGSKTLFEQWQTMAQEARKRQQRQRNDVGLGPTL